MPTEQQVTEVAKDLWPDVQASANALGRSKDYVLNEIEETFNEPYLTKYDTPIRLRQAVSIVYARMLNAETGTAEPFEFYVLDARTPREVNTKNGPNTVAEVVGIAKKIDEKREWDVAIAKIVLWGKHAEQAMKAAMNREKSFKVWARGGLNNGFYDLTATDKTNFGEEISPKEKVDALAVVQRFYRRILLREAPDNISKGIGDLRLIRATVMFARKGQSEKGNEYGIYRVYDESVAREDVIKNKGFSVMADPTQVRYDQGSVVWFLGNITHSEQYGPGMNAICAIPEVAVPLTFAPTAPAKATPATKVTPEQSASKFSGWGQ